MPATLTEPELQPAIRVRGVGKTYRMWASPGARLAVPLLVRGANLVRSVAPGLAAWMERVAGQRMHSHEALRDINLDLARGQALGIIGLNGSGKSTLLQIIAGVLTPSVGSVEVNGRVAALLELGSGFNPELSGRENIYINASILGIDRRRLDAMLDDIIAFADIGEYVDEPVKTYSSGMAVRLAFAVQVHTDPDILIVDEALAVGDAAFQAKAMARIDQILAKGTTLLFVGHDLNALKAFCHRGMLLERGEIVMEGLPDEVITEYLLRTHRKALQDKQRDAAWSIERIDDGYGVHDACVVEASINDASHVSLGYDEEVRVALQVRLRPDITHPGLILDVIDGKGLQLTGRRIALPRQQDTATVPVDVAFSSQFQQGIYRIRLRVVDSPALGQTTLLSRQEGKLSFEVVEDSRHRFTGLFPVPMDIKVGG